MTAGLARDDGFVEEPRVVGVVVEAAAELVPHLLLGERLSLSKITSVHGWAVAYLISFLFLFNKAVGGRPRRTVN